eukprot:12413575-Karenia_brevis.AAC.1
MRLRGNGGEGTRAMLRRFYIDHKRFIAPNGKDLALSNWIKAVQQGRTVPKSAEAIQILKDMNKRCTKEQLA